MAADVNTQFGSRLRDLRKSKGLTQEQLAEKAGLHYKFIGRVERGTDIKLSNIAKLANGLDISVSKLMSHCFPKISFSKEKEELLNRFFDILERLEEAKVNKILEFIDEIL